MLLLHEVQGHFPQKGKGFVLGRPKPQTPHPTPNPEAYPPRPASPAHLLHLVARLQVQQVALCPRVQQEGVGAEGEGRRSVGRGRRRRRRDGRRGWRRRALRTWQAPFGRHAVRWWTLKAQGGGRVARCSPGRAARQVVWSGTSAPGSISVRYTTAIALYACRTRVRYASPAPVPAPAPAPGAMLCSGHAAAACPYIENAICSTAAVHTQFTRSTCAVTPPAPAPGARQCSGRARPSSQR